MNNYISLSRFVGFKNFLQFIIIFVAVVYVYSTPAWGGIIQKGHEPVKIIGAQVFVFDEIYEDNLDLFFKEAKNKGVNTVFVRVFHNAGDRPHFHYPTDCTSGVYFKTSRACVIDDVLGKAIKAANDNDIKIFAWMATRSLSFLKTPENMSQIFLPAGGKDIGYGADIFNPHVRQEIVGLFEDLAKYNIDGILFQDDFIIKYNEGADDYSIKLFKEETGLTAMPETFFSGVKQLGDKEVFSGLKDEFYIWATWKNYHLMQLFKEIKDKVFSINPKIAFAANVYYETPITPKAALSWYSQTLDSLNDAGFDYYAVMGYAEQIGAEKKLDKQASADLIGQIAAMAALQAGDPSKVIIKLQSRNFWGDKGVIPHTEFNNICKSLEQAGEVGVAVVPIFTGSDIRTCDFNKE